MSGIRFTWIGVVATGVLLSAGCGEGRAIFNVDVLSYEPTLADTIPYTLGIGGSLPAVQTAFSLKLPPGLGNSLVESVTVTYGGTVLNTAGKGRFKIRISFDSVSATVFTSPVFISDSVIVTGPDTQPVVISVPVLANELFSQDEVWVGVSGSIANDSTTALTGRVVTVSQFRLRIVLQDKIF